MSENFDPTDFGCSDEHIPDEYQDYLDEFHPPLDEEELNELEALECDYIIREYDEDGCQELNFEDDIPY